LEGPGLTLTPGSSASAGSVVVELFAARLEVVPFPVSFFATECAILDSFAISGAVLSDYFEEARFQ
jgi:hypothetical protein